MRGSRSESKRIRQRRREARAGNRNVRAKERRLSRSPKGARRLKLGAPARAPGGFEFRGRRARHIPDTLKGPFRQKTFGVFRGIRFSHATSANHKDNIKSNGRF
jgi:hypothetical protein